MKLSGPWSSTEVDRFLSEALLPVRIACNGTAGTPVLASLWFAPEDRLLWCATKRKASVARLLTRDPRCAFEISGDSPPYFGVRGQAEAHIDEARGEEILRRLLDRYEFGPDLPFSKWLLSQANREVAIAIEPKSMVSWDYRNRMTTGAARP